MNDLGILVGFLALLAAIVFVSARWRDGPDATLVSQRVPQETRMSQTVAELLVDTLQRVGVKQIFGLIGDSLNPIANAVRRSKIKWVEVRREEGPALAAVAKQSLPRGSAFAVVRPAREHTLYTQTISASAQAAAVIHQVIGAAYAGRGVAHLTLPTDILQAKAQGDLKAKRAGSPLPP
jgi:pyruvate dehydrogenase (quinone)